MSIKIIDIVDELLVKRAVKAAESKERDYTHFHPSEWYGCKRKIAYAYYEANDLIKVESASIKVDPNLERIFDNGHKVHERWKDYLEASGMLKGYWRCQNFMAHETPKVYGTDNKIGVFRPDKCECGSDRFEYEEVKLFEEETLWGGQVDSIIDLRGISNGFRNKGVIFAGQNLESSDPADNHIVIDYKSMNPRKYSDLEAPLIEHICQMQIYLYLSGLKVGVFIYEDKGYQKVKEYVVYRDDDKIQNERKKALSLKQIVQHDPGEGQKFRYLPPRPYTKRGEKECLLCKFRGGCWK